MDKSQSKRWSVPKYLENYIESIKIQSPMIACSTMVFKEHKSFVSFYKKCIPCGCLDEEYETLTRKLDEDDKGDEMMIQLVGLISYLICSLNPPKMMKLRNADMGSDQEVFFEHRDAGHSP
jgi:hypothetical protein